MKGLKNRQNLLRSPMDDDMNYLVKSNVHLCFCSVPIQMFYSLLLLTTCCVLHFYMFT